MEFRRAVLVVALAATVVLAGCSGGTGSGTATPTTDATSTVGGAGTDAEDLRASVLDAIAAVDTYALDSNQTIRISGPVDRTQTVERQTILDRTAREVRRNASVTVRGRTSESRAYLVDGTLYLASKSNVRRYSSRWVKRDVSANLSAVWANQDSLAQQRRLLANASSVELRGTETVDGTETRVLHAQIGAEEYARYLADRAGIDPSNVTVETATMTLAVATDTHRPVSMSTTVSYTVEVRGQAIHRNVSGSYDYEYGVAAEITLPEAARDAVEIDRESGLVRTGA